MKLTKEYSLVQRGKVRESKQTKQDNGRRKGTLTSAATSEPPPTSSHSVRSSSSGSSLTSWPDRWAQTASQRFLPIKHCAGVKVDRGSGGRASYWAPVRSKCCTNSARVHVWMVTASNEQVAPRSIHCHWVWMCAWRDKCWLVALRASSEWSSWLEMSAFCLFF